MKKIVLTFLLSSLFFTNLYSQSPAEVINFIKKNPQKAALYLIEGNQVTVNYNSNRLMPLASAVKTIIAIEFANQAAQHKFVTTQKVSGAELAKYFIPNTDGGAHLNWLNSINKKLTDSVSLLEIAKGMIKFSSNANTEFLEDFLGLDQLNNRIKKLGLKEHQQIYYFTAAALMIVNIPEGIEEKEWLEKLKAMPMATYQKKAEEAHQKLKNDPSFIKTFDPMRLSMDLQKVWSDRLVASTTETYANLMQKILSKNYFDSKVQPILESIIEWPMEFTGNKTVFNHLGQKGGSTAFVLTDAFFAETKTGDQFACAFFFNDLNREEMEFVQRNFALLEGSILTSKKFRAQLAEVLNQP